MSVLADMPIALRKCLLLIAVGPLCDEKVVFPTNTDKVFGTPSYSKSSALGKKKALGDCPGPNSQRPITIRLLLATGSVLTKKKSDATGQVEA